MLPSMIEKSRERASNLSVEQFIRMKSFTFYPNKSLHRSKKTGTNHQAKEKGLTVWFP